MIPKVLAVMGPTACGKSSLAMWLATQIEGGSEIISADSAQVYIGPDIGTAKPSAEDMALVPHHLIDICHLNKQFSLANFQELATAAVHDIASRGRLPIIVGGTGLYLRGFLEGYALTESAPDPKLREYLNSLSSDELLKTLQEKDPQTYTQVDHCNKRRIVRALEIILQTGQQLSQTVRRIKPNLNVFKLGINLDRQELYQRIDKRLQAMLSKGWLEEVKRLKSNGWEADLRRLRILGYTELLDHLRGDCTLEEAVERIRLATHRYAKRQQTWLRREPDLHEFNTESDCRERIMERLDEWLAS